MSYAGKSRHLRIRERDRNGGVSERTTQAEVHEGIQGRSSQVGNGARVGGNGSSEAVIDTESELIEVVVEGAGREDAGVCPRQGSKRQGCRDIEAEARECRVEDGAGDFKKSDGVLCKGVAARYAFMKRERPLYPLRLLSSAMGVSRSGYYKWLKRKPSKREREDARLEVRIKAAHQRSRETYGAIRIKKELSEEGIQVGRDRIRRLRKELGLVCKRKKKFKATTNSKHTMPVSPDHLGQEFAVFGPDTVWVSDITYVDTDEGWLYVAGVKDLFSREVVGYAMGSRMTEDLVSAALKKAVKARRPKDGLIMHSDRGSQYCSTRYRRILKQFGMIQSMSRKGNCYDNAPMESFWGTLKVELVHHRRYETRALAIREITEYIEIFYNRIRRHSSLGNISPAAFLQGYYLQKKAA